MLSSLEEKKEYVKELWKKLVENNYIKYGMCYKIVDSTLILEYVNTNVKIELELNNGLIDIPYIQNFICWYLKIYNLDIFQFI